MNPNLTPVQRAARNLFAAETGITDPAMVELAFLNPAASKLAEDMAANFLSGPFGNFFPADAELTAEPACECKAWEGYVQALGEVRELLTGVIIPGAVSEDTRNVVGAVLERLDNAVAQRIADVNGEEADDTEIEAEASGTDALAEFFSTLFGRQVRVVRIA